MAEDEDDDFYDEEFDFVDDDEEDSDTDDTEVGDEAPNGEVDSDSDNERDRDNEDVPVGEGEEPVDEYGRPEQPAANYVVHIYEHKKFKRTIDRPFTPEDAEAFATEFNRTSKNYGRFALSGKNEAKPKKSLD